AGPLRREGRRYLSTVCSLPRSAVLRAPPHGAAPRARHFGSEPAARRSADAASRRGKPGDSIMMRWLARLAVAAALWGALCLWANLDDRNPYYLGLAAAVLASLTVVWLCVDAYSVALPPQWEIHYSHSPGRTFDPRFSRLSQELAEAANRQAAATALHES